MDSPVQSVAQAMSWAGFYKDAEVSGNVDRLVGLLPEPDRKWADDRLRERVCVCFQPLQKVPGPHCFAGSKNIFIQVFIGQRMQL
ncbi:hypothetical protein Peur_032840 [Populus x canadensis]